MEAWRIVTVTAAVQRGDRHSRWRDQEPTGTSSAHNATWSSSN